MLSTHIRTFIVDGAFLSSLPRTSLFRKPLRRVWTPKTSTCGNCSTAFSRTKRTFVTTSRFNRMKFVGAIDQGTSSTRFIIFDDRGKLVASHQEEFIQIQQHPGWLEHDPKEIIKSVLNCISGATKKFTSQGNDLSALTSIGITNQRETTIVWDSTTGEPLTNALVWPDTRTASIVQHYRLQGKEDEIRRISGLPLSTYFSAVKLRWMIDNVSAVSKALHKGTLSFGTVDSWIIYNLTGGKDGGIHVTDPTNASRTLLLDIRSLKYSEQLIKFFRLEGVKLPEIRSSSEVYGTVKEGELTGVKIAGCLGDQSAALVGHRGFEKGNAKNTYGTGFNTGSEPVISDNGLLTTVGFVFPGQKPVYALEGSIAVAGSAVKWARDQLGIIKSTDEIGKLAAEVDDTAGLVFITAFSGLWAPYWRSDVQGTIFGITGYTTKAHICRAILESIAFQTKAVLEAMLKDSGHALKQLNVDGGLTSSQAMMQIQSDVLTISLHRPEMTEVTALGAAIAAGLATGMWDDVEAMESALGEVHQEDVFTGKLSEEERQKKWELWEWGVERSLGWIKEGLEDVQTTEGQRRGAAE